jgi:hypothetical protein
MTATQKLAIEAALAVQHVPEVKRLVRAMRQLDDKTKNHLWLLIAEHLELEYNVRSFQDGVNQL